MTSSWDRHIEKLKKQVEDLKQTLDLDRELKREKRVELEAAGERLRALAESPAESRRTLCELPRILQSIMSDRVTGTIVVGDDGKFLLFNAPAERILGRDLMAGALTGNAGYFQSDRTTRLAPAELPWQRALRGEEVQDAELFLRRPDIPDGLWITVNAMPLRDAAGTVGGVVAFITDFTERVQVTRQIRKLSASLEHQIGMARTASSELKHITEKLSSVGMMSGTWPKLIPTPVPRSEPPAPDTAARQSAQTEEGTLILVVDDIPVNQKLLLLQLRKLGYTPHSARDGREAVSAAARCKYAVILMDCEMPVMDGFEATQAIREAEAHSGRHVPIIAMTSYDREGDRQRCLSCGMDDYLAKGVSARRLQEVLESHIRLTPAAKSVPAGIDSQPEPPAAVLVDYNRLRDAYGQKDADDILRLFLSSTATLLGCLQFALDDKDATAVNQFAFSLKGPCAAIGIKSMADLASELNMDAHDGNWAGALAKYTRLKGLFARAREDLAGSCTSAT